MRKLTIGALCALMAIGSTVGIAQAQAPSGAAPMRFAYERHPEIRKAIRALERTRADLMAAAHDFGGHRTKAVEAVDRALSELHAALAWDRN